MDWRQWEGHTAAGRFHLRRYLGGSASGVYLTETAAAAHSDSAAGSKAAIKLIRLDSADAEAWILRRELAAGLSHPGLLRLTEFGRCDLGGEGLVFALMEYADEDLSLVIPSRALALDEAGEVVRSVADTLAYLHGEGFVHGRLKLSNILAVEDRIKISSDELLRIGEPAEGPASTEGAPPEGSQGLTQASDVWSLGRAIVEMLTQRPPVRTAAGDIQVPDSLPAPYRDLARRCLCLDPRRRCSIEEIRRALSGAVEEVRPAAAPVAAVEPQPASNPASNRPRTPRRRMVWLAAGVFTGVILTGALVSRNHSGPQTSADAPSPAPVPPTPVPSPVPASVAKAPVEQKTGEILPPPAPARSRKSKAREAVATDRAQPEVPVSYLATIRGEVRVAVRVHVDSTGLVAYAELASPSGGRYFDRISLETARRWKFEPSESTKTIDFDYRPTGCHASERDAR